MSADRDHAASERIAGRTPPERGARGSLAATAATGSRNCRQRACRRRQPPFPLVWTTGLRGRMLLAVAGLLLIACELSPPPATLPPAPAPTSVQLPGPPPAASVTAPGLHLTSPAPASATAPGLRLASPTAALSASPLSPAATAAPASPTPTPALNLWRPPLQTTWQWQLGNLPVDTSVPARLYDVDGVETSAHLVAGLHAAGRHVVCYINVGAYEDWRPDKDRFPPTVIGAAYAGWPGERWLDIRQIATLAPIMRARFDLCRQKGFDAIEPDNIDGYTNSTGFPLTYQDQIAYNTWLAKEAHARGLSIGLKNDADQVADLLAHFDWALSEDCYAGGWCAQLRPFVAAGKAVFQAEYTDSGVTPAQFCPQAAEWGFNAIWKHRDLDSWRGTCP